MLPVQSIGRGGPTLLEHLEKRFDKIDDHLRELTVDVAQLKVKASYWALAASAIPALLSLAYIILERIR